MIDSLIYTYKGTSTLFLTLVGLIGLVSIILATLQYSAAIRFIRQGLKKDLSLRVWYSLNAQKKAVNGSLLFILHLASGAVIWAHGGLFMKIPNSEISFGTIFIAAIVLTSVTQILKSKWTVQQLQS